MLLALQTGCLAKRTDQRSSEVPTSQPVAQQIDTGLAINDQSHPEQSNKQDGGINLSYSKQSSGDKWGVVIGFFVGWVLPDPKKIISNLKGG